MKVFGLSCILLLCVQQYVVNVKGQGALIAPAGRSVMWAHLGNADYANELKVNKDYMSLNCGGRLVTPDNYQSECGPCGDPINHKDVTTPRPNEAPGGKYAIGKVVAIYHENDQINVTLNIKSTMHKSGAYLFSICKTDSSTSVTHDCFSYPLTWGLTSQTQIPSSNREGIATYNLQLPDSLTCEFCVLQWLWLDGTETCDPPSSSNCGRRVISNCADIRIIDKQRPIPPDFDWPRYDEYSSILSPPPESSTIVIVTPRPGIPGVTTTPSTSVTIPKPVIGGQIPVTKVTDVNNKNDGGTGAPIVSQSLVDPVIPVAAGTLALASGGLSGGVFIFLGMLYLLYEAFRQQSMGIRESAFSVSPFINNHVLGNSYFEPSSLIQYGPSFSSSTYQMMGNIGPSFAGLSELGNSGASFGTFGNDGTRLSSNRYFGSEIQPSGNIGQSIVIPGGAVSSLQTFGNVASRFPTSHFAGSGLQSPGSIGQRTIIPRTTATSVQGLVNSGGRIQTPGIITGSTFPASGNSATILPVSPVAGSTFFAQGTRSFSTPQNPGSTFQTHGTNVGSNLASTGTVLMSPTIVGTNRLQSGNIMGVTTNNQNRIISPNTRFQPVDSRVVIFPSVRPEFDQVPRTEVKKVVKPTSNENNEPRKTDNSLSSKVFKEAECNCHYKGDYYVFVFYCRNLDKGECTKNSDICSC